MAYDLISLNEFNRLGYREDSEAIIRYARLNPMFYRTNDYSHSFRVLWLLEEVLPYAVKVIPNFNPEKARAEAPIHDLVELITGDIQLDEKRKMTKEEKLELDKKEAEAIEFFSAYFPKEINGFNLRELLYNAKDKDTPEAQLVSLVDKRDGWGEAMHEVYAGNELFIEVVRSYDEKHFIPRKGKWPLIKDLFEIDHPFLNDPVELDYEAIAERGIFHTLKSIYQESSNPAYDLWRKITIARDGPSSLVTWRG